MKISYELSDIFSLLICAEVYGFGDDILYHTLLNIEIEDISSKIDEYINETYLGDIDIEKYRNILIDLVKMYL